MAAMEIDNDELIVVDLGELSRTRFGVSVKEAHFMESEDGARIHIDTGLVTASFDLNRINPSGTYVIYAKDGTVLGKTREVFHHLK